jgi:hypothetical protein
LLRQVQPVVRIGFGIRMRNIKRLAGYFVIISQGY